MRIAVVGAGSSGLITCKHLRDVYPVKDIVCFERGDSVRGCWGDQRPEFVSTSTKYTTQFSCFRRWPAEPAPGHNFEEFYRGGEFGDYLEAFAEDFDLTRCVRFGTSMTRLERVDGGWRLHLLADGVPASEDFDAVFLCTGLVSEKVTLASGGTSVAEDPYGIRGQRVVVVGGGESAVDVANHLARPELGNTTYLSLRSGVWVSPRYHPIRGVPSDFLRNRLLLWFGKSLRNRVGRHFVSFRMRFPGLLSWLFPGDGEGEVGPSRSAEKQRRRDWDLRLKARARGELFDAFHTKSDDFLDAVAQGRLSIIGPPVDDAWQEFADFDELCTSRIAPSALVLAAGYRSGLADLSGGSLTVADFYRGCVHTERTGLFLIGFARPVIGNIPSISEMQARYAVGVLSGRYSLPKNLILVQADAWRRHCADFGSVDTGAVYRVEQFVYCDALAREMGILPSLATLRSVRLWLKLQLVPASTTHYVDEHFDRQALLGQRVFMPAALVAILAALRALSLPWRGLKQLRQRRVSAQPHRPCAARGATPLGGWR